MRVEAAAAIARGRRTPQRGARRVSGTVRRQRRRARGAGRAVAQCRSSAERLRNASRAFERERFTEARKLLKPLAERAPGSAPVRELYGLTLYRLGQWRAAARELEAFRTLTGSAEQLPVLADCYRALRAVPTESTSCGRSSAAASPSAEVVTEGRIVAAGALADRGELDRAIRLLEAGQKPVEADADAPPPADVRAGRSRRARRRHPARPDVVPQGRGRRPRLRRRRRVACGAGLVASSRHCLTPCVSEI